MKQVIVYNYNALKSDFEVGCFTPNMQFVGFDRLSAYRKVAKIFADNGCKKVALADHYSDDCSGYVTAGVVKQIEVFKKAGLEVFGLRSPMNLQGEEAINHNIGMMIKLYKEKKIDCVFWRNDLWTARAINELGRAGIRVPADIAFFGMDNSPFSEFLPTPLSSIRLPVEKAVARVIELLENGSSGERVHLFECELVLRKSHGMSSNGNL
jgi:DNA-binding LacI/PurR family transcriptional regulator